MLRLRLPSGARGAVSLLVATAAVALACESAPERRVVDGRLADEAAEERQRVAVPIARIGRETRHSLLPLPRVPLEASPDVVTVADDGTAEVAFTCHRLLLGRSIIAETTATLTLGEEEVASSISSRRDRVDCRADAPPTIVTLAGLEPGATTAVTVLGFLPPDEDYVSPYRELEPRTALEVGIGMARPREDGSARFEIVAENRDGERQIAFERDLAPDRRPSDRGWVDVEIDLDPAIRELGSDLRLRFRTTTSDETLAFPVWASPTLTRRVPDAEARPPNVILVSLDTLRADRTGTTSPASSLTPRLDAWAAGGAVFDRAMASANWTLPSHATMLTGAYSCVHGIAGELFATDVTRSLRERGITALPRVLRDAGYRTAAFTENAYVAADVFHDGFELFDEDATLGDDEGGSIDSTIARADAWIERHKREPFFVFLHSYEVHAPYEPPERYASLHPVESHPWPRERPPGAGVRSLAAAYGAEVRRTDDAVADFLDRLAEKGLADRTIVILTSDHGESFSERQSGPVGHGVTLFDDELHVPLVFVGPGIAGGTRVPAIASSADIVPTLLELLSLDVPAGVQGRSAAAVLRTGEVAEEDDGRVVPSGAMRGSNAFTGLSWRIVYRDRDEKARGALMYDFRVDPLERKPLRTDVVTRLASQYRTKHHARCEEARASLGPSRGEPIAGPMPIDPARARKLEALGYTE